MSILRLRHFLIVGFMAVVLAALFLPVFTIAEVITESEQRSNCFVVVSRGPFLEPPYGQFRCPGLHRDVNNPKHNPDTAQMRNECYGWCRTVKDWEYGFLYSSKCEVIPGNLVFEPSAYHEGTRSCSQRFCQQYTCKATVPDLGKFYLNYINSNQQFLAVSLNSFDDVSPTLSAVNSLLPAAQTMNNLLVSFPSGVAINRNSKGSLTAQVANQANNISDVELARLFDKLSQNPAARTKAKELLEKLIQFLTSLKAELENVLAIGPSADLNEARALLAQAQESAQDVADYFTNLLKKVTLLDRFGQVVTTAVSRVGKLLGLVGGGERVINVKLEPVTLSAMMEITTRFYEIEKGNSKDILAFLNGLNFSVNGEESMAVTAVIKDRNGKILYRGENELSLSENIVRVKFAALPSARDAAVESEAYFEVNIEALSGMTITVNVPQKLAAPLAIEKRVIKRNVYESPVTDEEKNIQRSKSLDNTCGGALALAKSQGKTNCERSTNPDETGCDIYGETPGPGQTTYNCVCTVECPGE